MKEKGTALWITQTAVFIALLIMVQVTTSSFGNTLVTGSCVNCLLIISAVACGPRTGLWVAVLSPAAARLLGIGPLWSLIPLIILGNIVLVLIWNQCLKGYGLKDRKRCVIALIAAVAAKFLVLYVGIVKIVLPVFLHLPEKQGAVISHLFSIPQLATALIGGGMALMVLPVLMKMTELNFISGRRKK